MNTVEILHPRPEIAILRLNRPKSLNALSWELVEDLHAALYAIDRDNRCRVVVLTGAGRGFCAGLDLRDQGNPRAITAGLDPAPRAGLLAQNRTAGMIPHLPRTHPPLLRGISLTSHGG